MKFIHTADWHLGYRQYGMSVREEDFMKPLDEIADIAIREKAEAVLVAGDIFDSYRPPASAVQAARRFGRRMVDAGIQVLSIDGNHDMSGGKWAQLCGFRPLEQEATDDKLFLEIGNIRFVGIDFCRTAQLIEKLNGLIDRKCDLNRGVIALHMEIAEMAAYSTAISIRDLEPYFDALNVGYVALGHIHNAISTSNMSGRVYRYSGSTEMNDISELGPKEVDIVTRHCDGTYDIEQLHLTTRNFEVVDIDTAESVDTKLASVVNSPDTFWLVKVNLSAPGKLITRVEDALKDRLYRILPYGNRTIQENVEKKNVVVGLKDAINRFFEPDSDEASLVSRMIDTPEQVKNIAAEYVDPTKTKEVK